MASDERTDETLLARVASEPAAFEAFYRRYVALVTGYFVRRTRSGELAADLTAETFASVFESAERFDAELGSARSWLFGIAHHRLLESLRQGEVETRARRRLGLPRIELTDADIERIEASGSSIDVGALLDELPEDQRIAIVDHVIGEQPYEAIATELRCSEAVVRQRVSRGLRALRQLLEGAP